MKLPIIGQGQTAKPSKDFRNCSGCARFVICHPGEAIPELAAGEVIEASERCADFIPGEVKPGEPDQMLQ
jgi:hypothetical protein